MCTYDYTLIVVLSLFFLVIDLSVLFLLLCVIFLIIITDSKLWVASLIEHFCFSDNLSLSFFTISFFSFCVFLFCTLANKMLLYFQR